MAPAPWSSVPVPAPVLLACSLPADYKHNATSPAMMVRLQCPLAQQPRWALSARDMSTYGADHVIRAEHALRSKAEVAVSPLHTRHAAGAALERAAGSGNYYTALTWEQSKMGDAVDLATMPRSYVAFSQSKTTGVTALLPSPRARRVAVPPAVPLAASVASASRALITGDNCATPAAFRVTHVTLERDNNGDDNARDAEEVVAVPLPLTTLGKFLWAGLPALLPMTLLCSFILAFFALRNSGHKPFKLCNDRNACRKSRATCLLRSMFFVIMLVTVAFCVTFAFCIERPEYNQFNLAKRLQSSVVDEYWGWSPSLRVANAGFSANEPNNEWRPFMYFTDSGALATDLTNCVMTANNAQSCTRRGGVMLSVYVLIARIVHNYTAQIGYILLLSTAIAIAHAIHMIALPVIAAIGFLLLLIPRILLTSVMHKLQGVRSLMRVCAWGARAVVAMLGVFVTVYSGYTAFLCIVLSLQTNADFLPLRALVPLTTLFPAASTFINQAFMHAFDAVRSLLQNHLNIDFNHAVPLRLPRIPIVPVSQLTDISIVMLLFAAFAVSMLALFALSNLRRAYTAPGTGLSNRALSLIDARQRRVTRFWALITLVVVVLCLLPNVVVVTPRASRDAVAGLPAGSQQLLQSPLVATLAADAGVGGNSIIAERIISLPHVVMRALNEVTRDYGDIILLTTTYDSMTGRAIVRSEVFAGVGLLGLLIIATLVSLYFELKLLSNYLLAHNTSNPKSDAPSHSFHDDIEYVADAVIKGSDATTRSKSPSLKKLFVMLLFFSTFIKTVMDNAFYARAVADTSHWTQLNMTHLDLAMLVVLIEMFVNLALELIAALLPVTSQIHHVTELTIVVMIGLMSCLTVTCRRARVTDAAFQALEKQKRIAS